jgi:hypothetical protein
MPVDCTAPEEEASWVALQGWCEGAVWVQYKYSMDTVWVQYEYSRVQYKYSMGTVEYSMGTVWVQ